MTPFESLWRAFAQLPEVTAIALGGSRAGGVYDATSDYDLYIYCDALPSEAERRAIIAEHCGYAEIGNAFWELEDDCTLNDGVDIDILYRSLNDFARSISAVVDEGEAATGYTTCMWHNLLRCRVLFDRDGRLEALRRRYAVDYPDELRANIIGKNMRLLTANLPSYDHQIAKAASRGDLVSVNHRTAAYLESYFDVLFALNRLTHPGEKRMASYAREHAGLLPAHFDEDLDTLFSSMFTDADATSRTLARMTDELGGLVDMADRAA
ncbi:nucleotidyltransferase [Bifidobacterium anseris]|uniref:Nucleotidyltransferase n=1 Tax=Bifidobacterium anseris TaxID=2020963 RepID=A0A2N5J1B4_9BIFI|nr:MULTISPECIES: DUF4037 domain-containing protein [Bifidobacterium]PLS27998.1 nucleotidyltransferase [Bifidobacterium anseris]